MREGTHDKNKEAIYEWMLENCITYLGARVMNDILPEVTWLLETKSKDIKRYVRRIMSQLKHEGLVCSTTDKGYWAKPLDLSDLTSEERFSEVVAEKQSAQEMVSRALDMLKDFQKEIKSCDDILDGLTNQPHLFVTKPSNRAAEIPPDTPILAQEPLFQENRPQARRCPECGLETLYSINGVDKCTSGDSRCR